MPRRLLSRLAPSHIILLSSICAILLGTVLLMLPFSYKTPVSFIDTLFTCVSAITGTGLLTTSLKHFSTSGLCIIITLAQIGALGLVTMTAFLLYQFFQFEPETQVLSSRILGVDDPKNFKKILLFLVVFTIAIEIIGALIMAYGWQPEFGWKKALAYGAFHSISAFSSVGLTLFDGSMEQYSHKAIILLPLTILMLLGTVGFITVKEFFTYITTLKRKKAYRFSLGTKIAWTSTILLIILAIAIFWGLEEDHALAAYNPVKTIINSIFNAVSSTGIGFTTVPINSLRLPTILMIMIVAFIGTSPGSTGSGIRTTTIALFFYAIKSVIWGKSSVKMFGETIEDEQVRKATAIIGLSVPWVIFVTFVLLILEPEFNFLQILFESISAFATLGLSTGITPYVSTISKYLLISTMFLGRVGPFTLIFAIKKAIKREKTPFDTEEAVLLE